MLRRIRLQISHIERLNCCLNRSYAFASSSSSSSGRLNVEVDDDGSDELYSDVPRPPRRKTERKPFVTPMKELIRRAKEEREALKLQPCRVLENPPENGLLVPELVEVAHRVYRAQESLLKGISELIKVVPVQRCRFCFEVHIGHVGHEIRTCTGPNSGLRSATHVWRKGGVKDVIFFPKCFHLYDRVGKPRVGHDKRHSVPRIPAVVELCIQAGVDLENFPSKRRTKPVYCIEGRIVDFESVSETPKLDRDMVAESVIETDEMGRDVVPSRTSSIEESKFDLWRSSTDEVKNIEQLSVWTLELWFEMMEGVKKIMESYIVWTCGYCPEVQVGPKGHKVRMCRSSKHQSRNGLHAWQEATLDDIVGPNYVWHVQNLNQPALDNNLKRYYGKAPAVVELCVQTGAPIPNCYRSMMRVDVIRPDRDEADLVA